MKSLSNKARQGKEPEGECDEVDTTHQEAAAVTLLQVTRFQLQALLDVASEHRWRLNDTDLHDLLVAIGLFGGAPEATVRGYPLAEDRDLDAGDFFAETSIPIASLDFLKTLIRRALRKSKTRLTSKEQGLAEEIRNSRMMRGPQRDLVWASARVDRLRKDHRKINSILRSFLRQLS